MGIGKEIIDGIEEGLVKLSARLGGPEAATHERAALDALRQGNIVENISEALSADRAVIARITGYDHKPLDTPTKATPDQTIPKRQA